MKYALIPVLNDLDLWMKANEYDKLSSLDAFMEVVKSQKTELDCAEWLWELYQANEGKAPFQNRAVRTVSELMELKQENSRKIRATFKEIKSCTSKS